MVASVHSQLFITQAGSMDALGIAEVGGAPGFVLSEPPVDAISQAAGYYLGVVGESVGRIANDPAAAILQGQGQVPVIERDEGTNAPGEQGIDQAVVKIQAAFIDGPGALGQDARPGE